MIVAGVDEEEAAKAESLSVTIEPSRGWPDFFRGLSAVSAYGPELRL